MNATKKTLMAILMTAVASSAMALTLPPLPIPINNGTIPGLPMLGPILFPGSQQLSTLILSQKCKLGTSGYDTITGCPTSTGPWPPLPTGRQGSLNYPNIGKTFSFTFVGSALPVSKNYTLIYYPDPWPGNNLICLGRGKSDTSGRLTLQGNPDIGTIPASGDGNATINPPNGLTGAKIWLVSSEDVNCTGKLMTNWHPSDYLFEFNPILYWKQ